MEDGRRELQIYLGECIRHKFAVALSEVVAIDLDAVHDGHFDNSRRALADLNSSSNDTVAGRTRKIRKSFCRIQRARRAAVVKVPRNVLELLSSLSEKLITARSPVTTPYV